MERNGTEWNGMDEQGCLVLKHAKCQPFGLLTRSGKSSYVFFLTTLDYIDYMYNRRSYILLDLLGFMQHQY